MVKRSLLALTAALAAAGSLAFAMPAAAQPDQNYNHNYYGGNNTTRDSGWHSRRDRDNGNTYHQHYNNNGNYANYYNSGNYGNRYDRGRRDRDDRNRGNWNNGGNWDNGNAWGRRRDHDRGNRPPR